MFPIDDPTRRQNTAAEEPSAGRRRLLAALTTGVGAVGTVSLATRWSRPTVDATILPVHAQATADAWFGSIADVDVLVGDTPGLLDLFVDRAEAGRVVEVAICVNRMATGARVLAALLDSFDGTDLGLRVEGFVPVNGVPTPLTEDFGFECEPFKPSSTATLTLLGDVAVGNLSIGGYGIDVDFSISPGVCTLSATPPECDKDPL